MYTRACLLGLVVFLWSSAKGQSGSLTGTVYDERTNAPLVGAHIEVMLADTVLWVASTEDGTYSVLVPIGIHSVRASMAGYATTLENEVWIRTGKAVVLDFQLGPAAIELSTGGITRERYRPGANVATVEQTLRYPAGFFDPARIASTFAGVLNTNDQANHISVRGNGPNANAWLLEGAEIVNPNHLSNAGTATDLPVLSGGGVNILSAQMLGPTRLLKGSLPVDRGNALGGVMDMTLRKGNNTGREWTAQAGLIGLDLSTEGPIGDGMRASYLLNYRYSALGVLGALGVDLGDEAIDFQDLSFHVATPLGTGGELRVFGFGGTSRNRFVSERDTSVWEVDKDGSDITYTAQTGAVGATLRAPSGTRASITSTVVLSATEQERVEDVLSPNDFTIARTQEARVGERKLSAVVRYDRSVSERTRASVAVSAMDRSITEVAGTRVDGWLLRPYIEIRMAFSEHFRMNLGSAYAHYTYNGSSAWEPRAALQWSMASGGRIDLTAGRRSQLPAYNVIRLRYADPLPWNERLAPTLCDELVLAYDHPISTHHTFHVEVYHQRITASPERDDRFAVAFPQPVNLINVWDEQVDAPLRNTGAGTNTGIEVSLQRTFANGYFHGCNATLYDSRFEQNGRSFDTRWNGRFIVNLLGGKEWMKRKEKLTRTWGCSGRALIAGGMRSTAIDTTASRVTGATVFTGDSYAIIPGTVKRLDLRIYLKREKSARTGLWALDLQNVLNTQNEANRSFDQRKNDVVIRYQLGLIPNLSYRVEF